MPDFLAGLDLLFKTFGAVLMRATMPPVIPVKTGPGSAFQGQEHGDLVVQYSDAGPAYTYKARPNLGPANVIAEHEVAHGFDSLSSLVEWVNRYDHGSIWVTAPPRATATVIAEIPGAPERGRVAMVVHRHPAWRRWAGFFGRTDTRDVTHSDLVDLVMDNAGDLIDPKIAKHLSKFRGVREVAYDADLSGDGGGEAVRVSWKGSGGQKGAEGPMPIPDSFDATIPAFTGAWAPGDEPAHLARLKIRVMPPASEGPPMFRVTWLNWADYELDAAEALSARVKDVFGDRPVYRGEPGESHFQI